LYFLIQYGVPFTEDYQFKAVPDSDVVEITLFGKLFANLRWDGDTDIPTFEFFGDFGDWYQEAQVRKKADVVAISEEFRKEFDALNKRIGDE
jgi:hypothetical protein